MTPEIPSRLFLRLLQGTFALLAVWILLWWQGQDSTRHFRRADPGPNLRSEDTGKVEIGEFFRAAPGGTALEEGESAEGSWPGFRGPGRDNIVTESIPLADRWPKDGPPIFWQKTLGEGHAAPAVFMGRVYLLDYDEAKRRDSLLCLSLTTGRELWRRSYPVSMKRNHGFSRTIPAVAEGAVVTIGPTGHVMCCDALTGELRWSIDPVREYGSHVPFWYGGQCPYVAGGIAVIALAGTELLLLGVDLVTGEKRWSTPNPFGITLSHSSIMPMEHAGRRILLYAGIGGFTGVEAAGPKAGAELFTSTAFKASVIAPSPLVLEEGRVLLTAGYGAGSMTLRVIEEGDSCRVSDLQHYSTAEALTSEQQTPIFYLGKIFAVMPKDGGEYRNRFVVVDPEDTSRILWASGKETRFGLGPLLAADGKIYILDDDGTLVMIDARADRYVELARYPVISKGRDAWGPLVITQGQMLLRDSRRLFCIDLSIDPEELEAGDDSEVEEEKR